MPKVLTIRLFPSVTEGPYHQAFPFREGALRLGKEGFDPDHPWQSDDYFAIR
jgi:hypothetical protein